ncbi:YwbE family protein [Bacillus cereus]|uniref:YwbE family protein n=1 Tax=Bacillus cereus TaxID=1396 RepID=A0A9W7QCG9_BACCE|nr:YwbE family protein [Bacillus cereus]KAB2401479.1 YwbE family protein [Bacillus cereus]KAB2426931.1 YwbE family protein [Bacillus cereus]
MYRMENMAVSFYIIYMLIIFSFRYSNSYQKLAFISKTVSGVVKEILTNTETHTYGIKVRLQNVQIGRVQSVG